jgi:hypothetical protein
MSESMATLCLMDDLSVATLLFGLAGVIVGALLRGRVERSQQLRDRMLSAADDFATSAQQAFTQLYFLYRDAVPDDAGRALDEYVRLYRETEARLARVVLLFGPGTPSSEAALAVSAALDAARKGSATALQNALILTTSHRCRRRLLGRDRARLLRGVRVSEDEVAAARVALSNDMDAIEDRSWDFAEAAWRAMQAPGRWRRLRPAARRKSAQAAHREPRP